MIKRLIAIGFIFACTSIAWMVLAGVTSSRTDVADNTLRTQVERMWGAPHAQPPPFVTAEPRDLNAGTEQGSVDGTEVTVELSLAHRQKGLLWYATYDVKFDAKYAIVNRAPVAREMEISLPFPAQSAVFGDLRFEIEGKPWIGQALAGTDRITGKIELAPGERVTLRAGYRSQGLDRWTYAFGSGVADVRNFRLNMRTNFRDIDFPEDGISPGRKERSGSGWDLTWEFPRLVTGVSITMLMPQKLQPGPLASQIATFAPVSLFFFIVVLLTIGVVKRIEIHPMHFFFLTAAFFAFHLLFAYLADHVAIHAAFVIAAVTSLALATSYLRLVFGTRFAFLAAGTAQLVYLVLFSYAFFFKGLTGLAITVGAILTLFVLMQATARVDWSEIFTKRGATKPPDPSALSVC